MLLRPSRSGKAGADSSVASAYLAGTVAGALLTAVSVWILSGLTEPLSDSVRLGLLVAGSLFIWLAKEGPLTAYVRLPEARRQIPASVFGGRLAHGAFRFGLELGTGVRTYVTSIAPYILVLALLLARPTLGSALLAGLGFGIARAVPVMVRLGAADRVHFTLDFARGVRRFPHLASSGLILMGAILLV